MNIMNHLEEIKALNESRREFKSFFFHYFCNSSDDKLFVAVLINLEQVVN